MFPLQSSHYCIAILRVLELNLLTEKLIVQVMMSKIKLMSNSVQIRKNLKIV